MSNNESSFFLRRIHSLLGVLPLGVFLIQHLIVNYQATISVERFNFFAKVMENLPFVYFLEIFVIYIPILFHAIYGVYIAFTAKNNVTQYSTYRNWMFVLQRVSGVITFIFVVIHVWQTRVQKLLGETIDYDLVASTLSNPFWFIVWLVGIVATVFHFANGLWSFMITWGITQSDRSQKVMGIVSIFIFLVVTFIGLRALFAFI